MQLETVLLIDSYELKRNMESRKHESLLLEPGVSDGQIAQLQPL